jgi:CxxC motif-containing protein
MPEERQFICVTCPVGCSIEATVEGETLVEARGHTCQRGLAFVREELTNPRRMFTTTVRVRGGSLPLVPVRSAKPLPKGLLLAAAAALRHQEMNAPVQEHQVVMRNILNTGIDIITSRAIAKDEGGRMKDERERG